MPDKGLDDRRDPGVQTDSEIDIDQNEYAPPTPPPEVIAAGALDLFDQLSDLYLETESTAEVKLRLAVSAVAGPLFHAMTKEKRSEFISLFRFYLMKSDRRVLCPECQEPSLPYFLPHTEHGTVQLQHRHAEQTTHIIYGSRGGRLSFPPLTLVHVKPADSTDAEK